MILDNEKGLPVVNYESPEIFIKSQCKKKEKGPIRGDVEESSATTDSSAEENEIDQTA